MMEYKIIHERNAKTGEECYLPMVRDTWFFGYFGDWQAVHVYGPFERWLAYPTFQDAHEAIKQHHMRNMKISHVVEYAETTVLTEVFKPKQEEAKE